MADSMVNIEGYNSEFRAAVEQRQGRPIIDVLTAKKLDPASGLERDINVVDIAGVPVESLAKREEIEATIAEIHPTADALELLQAMALTYQQGRGLIAEGGTSRGKTYLMNKFTQIIFGRGVKPVDFYCNGQTDTMSLMAKWVPKTDNPEDGKRWEVWTTSEEGKKAFKAIIDETQKGSVDPEDIQDRFSSLVRVAGITGAVSGWQLQFGALPRAMVMPSDPTKPISDDNPSQGIFLHLQEVGLAETHVIDALLQLGGEKGKLATEIQLWDDGGRIIEGGPKFWVYFSTNTPEEYPNRQAIDQALARRNTFIHLGNESAVSRQLRQYLDNNIPYEYFPENLNKAVTEAQKHTMFPIDGDEGENTYNSPEYVAVRLVVSDAVSDFHEKLKVAMVDKKIEQRTKQRFEITDDEWNMVYDFMRRFSTPDTEATLDRAILLHYIGRFTDKGQQEAWTLWQQVKTQKDFRNRVESSQVRTYEIPGTGEKAPYLPIPLKTKDSAIPSGSIVIFEGKKLKWLGIDPKTKEERYIGID